MAGQKRAARERRQSREIMRILKFGAIPLIVILLIAVIIAADRGGKKEESDPLSWAESPEAGAPGDTDGANAGLEDGIYGESGTVDGEAHGDGQGEAEPAGGQGQGQEQNQDQNQDQEAEGPPEESAETVDASAQPLQQDALLELTGLVRLYCEAKTECDPDLLAQVFGIRDWTEERKEQERAKMELVKASVKSYENISCYSVQGPGEDSYVIFPYYEIRYRATETLLPAISWAYVKKDESGQYYMVSETDEDAKEYIRKVGEKPEVKAVMAQVQAKQQETIGSDEALQKIYGGSQESEVIIKGQ